VWTVRGLTAAEIAKATLAEQHRTNLNLVLSAMTLDKETAGEVRKLFGTSNDVPGDTARRLEMLVLGSVEPTPTLAEAVKLAEVFPVVFLELTNKILELSGLGQHVEGKAAPSGD
jgi:hypothetical protein